MFSVRPTSVPLSVTVATVSRPRATRSWRVGDPSGAQSNTVVNRQAVSPIHCCAASLSPSNGSAIRPARSRSRWASPGTAAGMPAASAADRACGAVSGKRGGGQGPVLVQCAERAREIGHDRVL